MRYHNITMDDMLNGSGLRTVLWLSGCTHRCKGCHNPITWDINTGLLFDKEAKDELYNNLKEKYISGVTFSGGDPLHPENREELGVLIQEIYTKFPNKDIWLYTGFKWEDIKDLAFISYVDVIVDGKFYMQHKENNLHWRGSRNQRVIDVKATLKAGEVVLYCK